MMSDMNETDTPEFSASVVLVIPLCSTIASMLSMSLLITVYESSKGTPFYLAAKIFAALNFSVSYFSR